MEINKAKELKAKMESDIADILKNFELETGLCPGIVFHERMIKPGQPSYVFNYKVNIPVHL